MSQPNKRRRIDGQFSPSEGPSEDFNVNKARKENDLRLKSRFESIFEKYGKDFSSVGDEIDLAKGTIVVDNGHLTEMGDEHDVGRGLWDDFHPEDESEGNNDEPGQDNTLLPDIEGGTESGNAFFQEWVVQDDYNTLAQNGDQPKKGYGVASSSFCGGNDHSHDPILNHQPGDFSQKLDTEANLDTVTTPQYNVEHERLLGHENHDTPNGQNLSGDSLWDAPPIPTTALTTGLEDMAVAVNKFVIERTPSPDTSGSLWAAPHSRRRRIPQTCKAKNLPKRTPTRKSKATSDESDSDDPIQDHTPISSTSRRSINVNAIISPKNAHLRTPTPLTIIDTPHEEPAPSLEFNGSNDVTINEQESASKGTIDTPLAGRLNDPVTPTSLECNLETDDGLDQEVVATGKKDQSPGADGIMDNPGAVLMASRGLLEPLTPQEVKTLVTLRLIKRKPWREVSSTIPSRSNVQLRQWYYVYCNRSIGSLSTPKAWTDEELEKLSSLTLETQNSWDTIQSKFLDKSLEDIQREWVKTCVGEKLWESWVNSKTPRKAKKRSFAQDSSPPQTPIPSTATIASPLRPITLPRGASERPAAKQTLFDAVDSPENRDESPDPLSEAFEKAWHGTGLSGVQISTPPRTSRSPKKHLLSGGKARSIVRL